MPTSSTDADDQQRADGAVAARARPAANDSRAERDDRRRAVTVGGGAGERLRETPHQVVQRDRERDRVTGKPRSNENGR